MFGFLGPNGAGKTTTLRILAGLAHRTSGAARVLGHDVTEAGGDVRALIGFLPDVPAFYKWMTAPQCLRFAGSPFGLRREVLDMVAALRGRTTVCFSTHILADVERVRDSVAVIDHGRVAAHAPIDELRLRRGGLSRAVEVAEDGGLRLATDDLEAAS